MTQDGNVYGWGSNTHGQCGTGSAGPPVHTPQLLGGLVGRNVVAVAAGAGHSLAVTSDGALYGWGVAAKGQCGVGGVEQLHRPTLVPNLDIKVAAVAAGMGHTLCLTEDGALWSCGWNNCGQLGLGSTTDAAALRAVALPDAVVHCSCGAGHSVNDPCASVD